MTEMTQNLQDMSYMDLLDLREKWLKRGYAVFADLRQICVELGAVDDALTAKFKSKHYVYRDELVLHGKRRDLLMCYHVQSNVYLPQKGRGEQTEVVSVFLDAKSFDDVSRVCVALLATGDLPSTVDGQRLIPGEWLDTLLANQALKADAKEAARKEQAYREQRERLLKSMLISREV